jgi:uncharacterized protein YqhQ
MVRIRVLLASNEKKMKIFHVKKSLTFLTSHAIFFIVPLFEEALYLRTPTGELLHSGSPGFFYGLLKSLIFKKYVLSSVPNKKIMFPERG